MGWFIAQEHSFNHPWVGLSGLEPERSHRQAEASPFQLQAGPRDPFQLALQVSTLVCFRLWRQGGERFGGYVLFQLSPGVTRPRVTEFLERRGPLRLELKIRKRVEQALEVGGPALIFRRKFAALRGFSDNEVSFRGGRNAWEGQGPASHA